MLFFASIPPLALLAALPLVLAQCNIPAGDIFNIRGQTASDQGQYAHLVVCHGTAECRVNFDRDTASAGSNFTLNSAGQLIINPNTRASRLATMVRNNNPVVFFVKRSYLRQNSQNLAAVKCSITDAPNDNGCVLSCHEGTKALSYQATLASNNWLIYLPPGPKNVNYEPITLKAEPVVGI